MTERTDIYKNWNQKHEDNEEDTVYHWFLAQGIVQQETR